MTADRRFISRPTGLIARARRSALTGPAALVGAVMAVFAILFLALPAPAQTKPVSTSPADIAVGETLYDLHCSACHGIGAVGAKGPPLLGVGPAAVDFFLSTGRMPLSSPNQEPVPGPPYFNEAQIAQIVAYVNYLDVINGTPGPGIPDVTPPCAVQTSSCPTLSEGNQLFLLNCAQCHATSGAGGMLSHGYVVPSVRSATITEIAEAVRVGPRPMPTFGPGQLTDQQVSAIADYVYNMSHTPNPGGLGIGYFGPVPEGFVAVIFGLGALLLVARLIGNRG
ncbi:MAG TPA: c-type cytochrome [Acidimicrobiales bacterium]|nr:c-type cytochrome [Acidimicrobiales bacterium]